MQSMGAPELEALYRRWLSEVWELGRTDVARELMVDDLIDHNPYPGQPPGLTGHNWAVAMVRRAFPDLRFTADVVVSDGDLVAGWPCYPSGSATRSGYPSSVPSSARHTSMMSATPSRPESPATGR
jgi:predicted ester cyclase